VSQPLANIVDKRLGHIPGSWCRAALRLALGK